MPISVSSRHFALRYEVPKFLARGGHLCMAVLTIAAIGRFSSIDLVQPYSTVWGAYSPYLPISNGTEGFFLPLIMRA
eukprot:COSAG05_NODE_33_length_28089_cov_31.909289_14_plen_77_part_00